MVKLAAGNKIIECELVIFDKDGTLIDLTQVLSALARARKLAVEERGGKKVVDLWEKAMGVDLQNGKLDYDGPLATIPRQHEVLIAAACFYVNGYAWEEARYHAGEAYNDADESMDPTSGAVLLPGVEIMLRQMKARGLKLSIASTDTHRRIASSFEALRIAGLFDTFVGDDDVASGKPEPDMIIETLKRTNCLPEQSVIVGDSITDMLMGKNARVKACIGVLTGSTKKERLENIADVIVSSAAELRAL